MAVLALCLALRRVVWYSHADDQQRLQKEEFKLFKGAVEE